MNPFLTDQELAARFGVSVPTVRLDRLRLGIPELRERIQRMARYAAGREGVAEPAAADAPAARDPGSAGRGQVVSRPEPPGELVDLEPGRRGISLLDTTHGMAFDRSDAVRGHFLFAQAESLAVAVAGVRWARTELVNAKFLRPVRVGDRLVAKAEVIRRPREHEFVVLVRTRVGTDPVFRGKFLVSAEAEGVWQCG